MIRGRNVKVIATLGPASTTPALVHELYEAGADVFRVNMSHQDHDGLRRCLEIVREVERAVDYPIALLVDLQGPKLRIGTMAGGAATVETGGSFTLDLNDAPGDRSRAPLPHPEILKALKPGDRVLLDDGRIRLRAERCDGTSAVFSVVAGGVLSDHKGVNIPDSTLTVDSLTAKDREDLSLAASLEVDWIALSFVQSAADIVRARELSGGKAAVMAKIERPAALGCLAEIVDVADGIMVARGDLGVELPVEEIPGHQKEITWQCRRKGKPVTVATQMLESMVTAPAPTRAEVSDVATAVFDGADAIMLSAESAIGDYPVEAVTMMDQVARAVESDPAYGGILYARRPEPEATGADAISAAVHKVSDTLNLAAIVCYTTSGSTGFRMARERPLVPVLALTPEITTARRLTVGWGLHCVLTEDASSLDDMVERACRIVRDRGYGKSGDRIVITAGFPLRTSGKTNMLRVARLD